MPLLPDCREVTRLVLEAEERPLPWPDRMRIRLHLSMCQACTRFNGQVAFMRRALGQWRDGAHDSAGADDLPRQDDAQP